MSFFNREKEVAEIKAILSGEPNIIWFFYGPINSGKTALITKVIEELSEDYRVFYINFRGVETRRYEDFVRALFQPRDETIWEKLRKKADIIEAAFEYAEKVMKKVNFHFEVPTRVLKLLFQPEPERDVFKYLEALMRRLKEKGKKPVIVFDELQVIRELKKNGSVLHDLFNFLVRITKETHFCHSFCVTSDSLFIEEIYRNARLEGRMRSFLVDDLDKNEAFKMYEAFGFEEKELIWDYIGGKIGDMVLLFEEKKRGFSEGEIVKMFLEDAKNRLLWLKGEMMEKLSAWEEYWEFLRSFRDGDYIRFSPEKRGIINFWVRENVLFFDPSRGIIRPQGRLIWRAIRELI